MYMLKEDGEEISLTDEQKDFLVDMGLITRHGTDFVIADIAFTMEDIENQLQAVGLVG